MQEKATVPAEPKKTKPKPSKKNKPPLIEGHVSEYEAEALARAAANRQEMARIGVPEAAAQVAHAGSKGKGGNLGSEEGGKKSEGEKPAVQQPVRASTRERKPVQRADA